MSKSKLYKMDGVVKINNFQVELLPDDGYNDEKYKDHVEWLINSLKGRTVFFKYTAENDDGDLFGSGEIYLDEKCTKNVFFNNKIVVFRGVK